MFFIALLLFSALSVSVVAGWFSIVGLMAIFPAAAQPILAMGVVLEIAKLVTASWVYRYWDSAQKVLKAYFIVAVIVLSLITSMGIFGFLTKAHLEHTVLTGDNTLQIERLDRQISSEQRRINDAQTVLDQLDETVQTLIDYDRIRGDDGSVATRERQTDERQSLNVAIDSAQTEIDRINETKLLLDQEQLAIQVEIGPILYVAEMIYGNTDQETLDKAVRGVIMLLIVVFDPLAILLVIATNISLKERRGERISFISEKSLEPEPKVEDFGIQDTKTKEKDEPPDDPVSTDDNVLSENDVHQFKRLDRSVRSRLNWLIDKKGKNDNERK
tara:strand:+ start:90 stop:1079 length:990 start_codon:yes stop_codon:yes gene_type:complete